AAHWLLLALTSVDHARRDSSRRPWVSVASSTTSCMRLLCRRLVMIKECPVTQDDDRSDSSWPAHDIDGDVNEQGVESAADAAEPAVGELAAEQSPAGAGDGAPVGTGGSTDDAATATEATEATEAAGDEPDSAATPGRRRRRWAVAASAALVVVALAVVLAVPAVANGLGLPWAPNRPTGDPPEPTV